MNGHVQLFHDKTVPGPYTKDARELWLRRVLEAQQSARENGPADFREIELITLDEMVEIRRLWLHEKHEFDDSLPRIYEETTGRPFPITRDDDNPLQGDDWELLKEICDGDGVLFSVQTRLLSVEQKFRGMARRVGVTEALENCMKAAIFSGEDEAIEVLTERGNRLKQMRAGEEQAVEACIEPEKRSKKSKAEEDDESRQLVLFHDDPKTDSRGRSGRPE